MPYAPACQTGLRASMLAYQRGLRANVPACQRAKSVPASHFYVPTCQCAIRRANVLTWRAKVPNDVPIFQLGVPASQKVCQFSRHSSYEMLSEISILYYYIKHFTFYYILLHSRNSTFYHSYTYQMYMYHKWKFYYTSFLYFMTSCHIKEMCGEFFLF